MATPGILAEPEALADAGLLHLERLSRLCSHDLRHTNVTDAGPEHLGKRTRLRQLFLYDTKVTGKGIKRFQQALPTCEIDK